MGGHSASREYELSMLGEFRKWIEDSKVSQLDASTEEVINNLKKAGCTSSMETSQEYYIDNTEVVNKSTTKQ